MMCPGTSDEEVLAIIEKVVSLLAPKFVLGFQSLDDTLQDGRMFALELLAKKTFDAERGSLDAYIFSHVRRRYLNARRDNVTRTDPPCRHCHKGNPCGEDGRHCEKYAKWARRQNRKSALSAGASMPVFADDAPVESWAEEEAALNELLELIDAELPVELRSAYVQMRDGISLEKRVRVKVERALLAILEKAGVEAADIFMQAAANEISECEQGKEDEPCSGEVAVVPTSSAA